MLNAAAELQLDEASIELTLTPDGTELAVQSVTRDPELEQVTITFSQATAQLSKATFEVDFTG